MAESDWKDCTFNQFIKLNRGFDLPNDKIVDGKYPVVASTSIKAFHKVAKVKGPGVITGRSGSLGAVQYIEGDFWPLNTALYVKDFKGNHPQFVNYFLRCMRLENFNSGAGVPTLNQNHLHKLAIRIPTVKIQKKIASILSAYDDLIENNKRRIAILEKMAEEIYREWFVRMRFSGYEDQKVKGGLPSGWRLLPFSQAVRINPRETPGNADDFPFVGMEDLSTTSMYFTYKERRTSKAGSKFRNGDVLFPRITPSLENGKRGYVSCLPNDTVGIGSTEFIVFREDQIPKEYIYMISCSTEFRKNAEQSMVGASGRQRVHEKCFDSFLIRVPTSDASQKFSSIIAPMFEMISKLSGLNVLLAHQRDLLLPRLISGKLSVENLDLPSNESASTISSTLPQAGRAHA